MWAKVAEEMAIPWRAAEAMHWQLGEQEMARRAGVVPFSLSSGGAASIEPPPKVRRHTTVMPRLRRQSMHAHPAPFAQVLPQPLQIQPGPVPVPVPVQLQSQPGQSVQMQPGSVQIQPGQMQPQLPSVEELTAGVPAYSSPLTQPIIDPYRSRPPPLPLPHPPDMMIPRTRP
jgi:hypothetical protein